jgi:hypothetical protein
MAEATLVDPFSFVPFEGGNGKRLSCSDVSARVAIPGTQGQGALNRILVTNGGAVSAFIRMGQSNVVATLDSMEILPGTTQTFTVPQVAPSGLFVAGITESGATNLSIVSGGGI